MATAGLVSFLLSIFVSVSHGIYKFDGEILFSDNDVSLTCNSCFCRIL